MRASIWVLALFFANTEFVDASWFYGETTYDLTFEMGPGQFGIREVWTQSGGWGATGRVEYETQILFYGWVLPLPVRIWWLAAGALAVALGIALHFARVPRRS